MSRMSGRVMTSAVVPTRTFEEVQQQQRRSDPAGDRPLPGFRADRVGERVSVRDRLSYKSDDGRRFAGNASEDAAMADEAEEVVNPEYVPKRGYFYEHDDRSRSTGGGRFGGRRREGRQDRYDDGADGDRYERRTRRYEHDDRYDSRGRDDRDRRGYGRDRNDRRDRDDRDDRDDNYRGDNYRGSRGGRGRAFDSDEPRGSRGGRGRPNRSAGFASGIWTHDKFEELQTEGQPAAAEEEPEPMAQAAEPAQCVSVTREDAAVTLDDLEEAAAGAPELE